MYKRDFDGSETSKQEKPTNGIIIKWTQGWVLPLWGSEFLRNGTIANGKRNLYSRHTKKLSTFFVLFKCFLLRDAQSFFLTNWSIMVSDSKLDLRVEMDDGYAGLHLHIIADGEKKRKDDIEIQSYKRYSTDLMAKGYCEDLVFYF